MSDKKQEETLEQKFKALAKDLESGDRIVFQSKLRYGDKFVVIESVFLEACGFERLGYDWIAPSELKDRISKFIAEHSDKLKINEELTSEDHGVTK